MSPWFAQGVCAPGVLDLREGKGAALSVNLGYGRAYMMDGMACQERGLDLSDAKLSFIKKFDAISEGSVGISVHVSTIVPVSISARVRSELYCALQAWSIPRDVCKWR